MIKSNKCITGLVLTTLLALPLASANANVGETTTGTTVTSQDEATSIKKEIEALKLKYDQTSDAYEKNIITNKIDELTKKLESLNRATSPIPETSTDLSPQIKAQKITATIANNFTTLIVNVPDAKGWTWSVIWDNRVQNYDITSFPYKISTSWVENKEIQLYATNSLGHWGYSDLFTPSKGTDETTPTTRPTQDEATSIKKEIEALKAKYNQTKDAKEKDSINNKIAELTKKLESLNQTPSKGTDETTPTTKPTQNEATSIKKEIDALKAKYNQTKDAKEKDSIDKRITELTKKLESLNQTPSKGTDETTPTTRPTLDEATSIKKEIEALKAKYNQTKDAKEKDSIAKRIDELTKKLESLNQTPSTGNEAKTPPIKPTPPYTDPCTIYPFCVEIFDPIIKEIEALMAKYEQTTDTNERKNIDDQISELTKKIEILEDEIDAARKKRSTEIIQSIVSLINSVDSTNDDAWAINVDIKKLQEQLKAAKTQKSKKIIIAKITKLKKQKDTNSKKTTDVQNKVTDLSKELENIRNLPRSTVGELVVDYALIKELEELKTQYSQTKNLEDKLILNDKINELISQLQTGKTKIILTKQSD